MPHSGRWATRLVAGSRARSAHKARIFVRAPRKFKIDADTLRKPAEIALDRAAPNVAGDVTIVVVDDSTMRRLNLRYRGRDASTDVLSFPLGDGLTAGEPFGDVVISYPTTLRQARAYGATLQRELARLIIHGVLHLCGYDHHKRKEAARMHGLTRRLLEAVTHG